MVSKRYGGEGGIYGTCLKAYKVLILLFNEKSLEQWIGTRLCNLPSTYLSMPSALHSAAKRGPVALSPLRMQGRTLHHRQRA